MRKNILRIFLFFLISIVSFAANYRIEKLDIEANLQKDGSMVVSEAVTYDIDEINGVYFDIDAKGFGELEDLQVFEDDPNTSSFKEVDASNYEVSASDELYRIKLYSKNQNNIRTFKFVYKLPEAITVYDDVAQFNRKMVGQEWQQGIKHITAKVIVPVPTDYDNSNILVFGHGPLTGEVDKEGNTVVYKLDDYYPGDFLEAHILMEPEIFSEYNKSKIVHKDMKQELLDMEAKLSEEANTERDKASSQQKISKKQGVILGVLGSIWGVLMFYIYGIYRRKNRVKNSVGKYLRELPDDSSPALVGSFMTDSISGNEILATIVDLIRRKVLMLETSGEKSIITLVGNTEKLSAQERVIVDIYINDFGNGKSLDLKDFDLFQEVPMSTARKFEKWKTIIQSEMDRKDLVFEGFKGMGENLFYTSLGGIILGIKFFKNILEKAMESKMFLIIVIMGFILLISLTKARYPRKELAEAKDKWQAFKNFLSDYSQLEEAKITSVHLWEQYFVYAVALGVSDKVVKAYKKALDMGVINDVQGVNSLAYSPIFNPMFSRSFSNLNGMVSRTNSGASSAIASSRRSSSSGGGGGFSSHSSGGGGSRGGGGGF
ncbi:DUF2207 domain-containing protein [Fusobacterium periodonticum]|uniref:DUF2207 domain-containing protein n=3 Tax=Fusobacterium periodonticum TaxID=860 RepID=K1GFD4_9FUSO|nr:DUF2207 domain-containing protein [Fusobacterium periodonticum]AVQ24736.1 DUF2207 domain-containing protein [Fusobacterium periodonticum]EKA92814.1 hypothetical protein FPOG_01407 [Fusobacterium periodonticum D10]KGE63087.1 hypothetical protein FSAG_000774 [Fusobacterium periodonticum 2_1_31]